MAVITLGLHKYIAIALGICEVFVCSGFLFFFSESHIPKEYIRLNKIIRDSPLDDNIKFNLIIVQRRIT